MLLHRAVVADVAVRVVRERGSRARLCVRGDNSAGADRGHDHGQHLAVHRLHPGTWSVTVTLCVRACVRACVCA